MRITNLVPHLSTKNIAISLKSAAERSIRNGHPWVFDGSILKMSKLPVSGDIAIIFDKKRNKFLAAGLYDTSSPICIKILQFQKPATINKEWFAQKIQDAISTRDSIKLSDTNSYRLIHGENDGLPSFIADKYADVIVVKIYSLMWLPYLEDMMDILIKNTNCHKLVLRLSRNVKQGECYGLTDGQIIYTQDNKTQSTEKLLDTTTHNDEIVIFKEFGILFSANVIKGHKTGYFLDHRYNRHQVGLISKNKEVLDIFSYAGGFSVHAMSGGASKVTSIDISKQALDMSSKNMELNGFDKNKHELISGDAFEIIEEFVNQKRKWDIVIVDPPSFAKRKDEVDRALESYRKLAVGAIKLVREGGTLIMASCSSRVEAELFFKTIEDSFYSTGIIFRLMQKTYHDIDHPIGFPEGAYLKTGYYQL